MIENKKIRIILRIIDNVPNPMLMFSWEKELVKTALKKQLPVKVEDTIDCGFDYHCVCGKYLSPDINRSINFCSNCGQRLDWER